MSDDEFADRSKKQLIMFTKSHQQAGEQAVIMGKNDMIIVCIGRAYVI